MSDAQDQMLDQGQIGSLHGPVPRKRVLFLSVLAHLAVLAWIIFGHTSRIYVVPVEQQAVEILSAPGRLSYNPPNTKPAQPRAGLSYKNRSTRPKPVQKTEGESDGTGTEAVRQHAKQATAAIMGSVKFRLTYGFSPNPGDKLPVQTAGKIPFISADEVPLHFEQYVTVEVTIGIDGRVADARIVGGEVSAAIQQKLLSAIREFKYSPATRNGAPAAFQLDIVIHVPS
jgi:TonB family protein